MAYFVVVVIGSLLTINWCFFVIYMAHAIPRAALAARGGHCLFYNSVRYTRHMPFSGNAPSPSLGGRSSGLIKYELRSCSPSSRAALAARGGHGLFYNSVRLPRRMPFSGNAPSPSLGGRSSGLIKYELRSCSPSSRAALAARGALLIL